MARCLPVYQEYMQGRITQGTSLYHRWGRGGGGVVPEPHSFHLSLTLSHCSGTPGLEGFAREKGRQFFCLFSEKHQLFVLWPSISMLLFGGKMYKV